MGDPADMVVPDPEPNEGLVRPEGDAPDVEPTLETQNREPEGERTAITDPSAPLAEEVLKPEGLAHSVEEARCLNCDAPLLTTYCGNCAQRARTVRMDWHWLWHEVQHGIFHADRGILFTSKELLVRPGHMIREYLEGKRKRYFPPLAMITVLGTISVLVTKATSARFEAAFEVRASGGDPAPEDRAAMMKWAMWIMEHQTFMTLALLPFMAIGTWIMFRRYGHNFVEHLILNSYFAGLVFLISLAAIPIIFLPYGAYEEINNFVLAIMLGYRVVGLVQVYRGRSTVQVVLRSLAAFALTLLLAVSVMFALGVLWGIIDRPPSAQ